MDISDDYARRFGGIARLYGEQGLQALRRAHVCVVGVGGVGSWAVEALARSGVGELTLIDLDNIAVSNVNRQLHALTPDFGKAKVTALHERIMQIQPECRVHEIEDFVDEQNLPELFAVRFDFVIDAIDQLSVKAAMANHFVRAKQPFVVSGGAGGQRLPQLIECADLSQTRTIRCWRTCVTVCAANMDCRAKEKCACRACFHANRRLHRKCRLPAKRAARRRDCRARVMARACWSRRVSACIAPQRRWSILYRLL